MSDAEWLRAIVKSGWNNDLFSPEVKAMFSRVADAIEAPQLVWTHEVPAEPGWYWVRYPYLGEVAQYLSSAALVVRREREPGTAMYAGPIPKPTEPKQ